MTGQRHFHEELDRLKSRLVRMAGLSEELVRLAVESLLQGDRDKADEVRRRDAEIDALEIEIDEAVIQLLALQQPMARDLRFITIANKISNDLERVGDHAVNISEEAREVMKANGKLPGLPELREMVRLASEMLDDSLNAFIRADSKLAREIVTRDDRVDELDNNIFRILLTHMMEDPRKISVSTELLFVSRNLERIADLATNIAEDVVFLVEGLTIKHHAEDATTATASDDSA